MFRKRKENPPLTRQEAVQKLRSAEEMLSKKGEFLEKQIDVEEASARKLIASNNDRKALRALKRKKDLVEDEKENDRLSTIVKSQRRVLESNSSKIEVAKSLFEAAKGLISDAPQVQDNVRETIDYIQNVLDGSDNISRAPSQSEPAAAAALKVEVPVDESQRKVQLQMMT
ncbi:charged multivesicular body protein 4b-like isoform X2 [Montipora foliosa]|uniref:charged multivesicular body protein 4b-like isoform X2 n=1 Tax=Montipora foliosa TaxID=591990 RepID=UPI0035F1D6DD